MKRKELGQFGGYQGDVEPLTPEEVGATFFQLGSLGSNMIAIAELADFTIPSLVQCPRV